MARPHGLLFVALCMFAFAPGTARAAASVDSCTGYVPSLPATITTHGTWCLAKDLSTGITSGAAITVTTNNVTIDCGGYKIGGLPAGPGTGTTGIQALGRQNTTVRDCAVRGFLRGISLEGNGQVVVGNRVREVVADGNLAIGIAALSGAHQPVSDFDFHAGMVTWSDAEAACVAGDGHLASIGTALENFTVQGLVLSSGGPAWIGATDTDLEGLFTWVDGSLFAYQNWASGEPDNDAGTGGNGDFVAMLPTGEWLDTDGAFIGFVAGYVCEVPKPLLRMSIRDNVVTAAQAQSFGTACQDVDGRMTGNVFGGHLATTIGCADGGFNHVVP